MGDKIPYQALSPFKKQTQRKIVKYHNYFRTIVEPPASNMLAMVLLYYINVLERILNYIFHRLEMAQRGSENGTKMGQRVHVSNSRQHHGQARSGLRHLRSKYFRINTHGSLVSK